MTIRAVLGALILLRILIGSVENSVPVINARVITMKRFLAIPYNMGIRKAMLAVLVVSMLCANSTAYAETITKVVKPDIINVLSNGGSGLAQFNLFSTDFPSGTLAIPRKLQGIDWTTTSYLQSIGEDVELCFYLPFNSTQVGCERLSPNASGTLDVFNNQRFGNGSKVIIRHTIKGGSDRVSRPAGSDSLTFRFSQ